MPPPFAGTQQVSSPGVRIPPLWHLPQPDEGSFTEIEREGRTTAPVRRRWPQFKAGEWCSIWRAYPHRKQFAGDLEGRQRILRAI
jgi:hypothetical protein